MQASYKSVRELCGQRVSPQDWDIWMNRMYGSTFPPPLPSSAASASTAKNKNDENLFNQAGRVMRVLVTFRNGKEAIDAKKKMQQIVQNITVDGIIQDSTKHILGDEKTQKHTIKCADHIKKNGGNLQFEVDQTLNMLVVTITSSVPILNKICIDENNKENIPPQQLSSSETAKKKTNRKVK